MRGGSGRMAQDRLPRGNVIATTARAMLFAMEKREEMGLTVLTGRLGH